MVGEGSPGHGAIHLLSAGAAEIGFRWDPVSMWSRAGQPLLSNLAGPFHISRLLFLMLGVKRLQLIFAAGKAFGWRTVAGCAWLFAAS